MIRAARPSEMTFSFAVQGYEYLSTGGASYGFEVGMAAWRMAELAKQSSSTVLSLHGSRFAYDSGEIRGGMDPTLVWQVDYWWATVRQRATVRVADDKG